MKVLCLCKGGELLKKVGEVLEGMEREIRIFSTSKMDTFQRELLYKDYNLILMDLDAFPKEATRVLAWLRGVGKAVPVILLVSDHLKEEAIKLFEKGAYDYALKSDLEHLRVIFEKEKKESNLRRQRERLNQLIRETDSRYGSIVESSKDVILVVEDGRIVFANRTASDLTGLSTTDLLGKDFSSLFFPIEDGSFFTVRSAEGERTLEASRGPIRWLNRKADLLMLRDVTEKKKAEERLNSLFNFALQINGIFHLDKLKSLLIKHLREIVGDVPIHLLYLTPKGARLESWSKDGKREKSQLIKVLPTQLQDLIVRGDPKELKVSELKEIEGLPEIVRDGSLLLVPVKHKDKPFGSIIISNGKRIDWEAVAVVQTMASELAVALENIELFGDLQHALRDLERSYQLTMEILVTALDMREHETQFHSIRVASYAAYLAKELGLEETDVKYVYWGGLLHDIGKIGVPDSILLKPGALTEEEWQEMKKHPEIGYKIIKGIKFLGPARNVVLYHHERWDGRGYPKGLKGKEIPIYARIFAFADTLDAITNDRPYRKAQSFDFALEEIMKNAGSQFDPEIAEVFLRIPVDIWISIRKEVLLHSSNRIQLWFTPPLEVLKSES